MTKKIFTAAIFAITFGFLLASTIASAQTPLTVISPNGGEVWNRNARNIIEWSGGSAATVDVALFSWHPPCTPTESSPCPLNPVFKYALASQTQNDGIFEVNNKLLDSLGVPDGRYIAGISAPDEFDTSAAPFSIVSNKKK